MDQHATIPDAPATSETAAGKLPSIPRLHAIVMAEDGSTQTLSFVTRVQLGKALAEQPGVKVLGVFKGKQLSVKERKSFNFC